MDSIAEVTKDTDTVYLRFDDEDYSSVTQVQQILEQLADGGFVVDCSFHCVQ